MINKRFVQFPHPGGEHGPETGCGWNRLKYSHMRKFMKLQGRWSDAEDKEQSGELWAWGEWEAESEIIREFNHRQDNKRCPRYLWSPYYVPKKKYRGLHNTDPFIFGDRFLYSNCGQLSEKKVGLKCLDRGSIIVFGSAKKINGDYNWQLDTVFVVNDFTDYAIHDAHAQLNSRVPDEFMDVTVSPIVANTEAVLSANKLRLYRGATPDDPVHGMYSFFPAVPAGGDSGFARPVINLSSECFNPENTQAPKGIAENGRRFSCDEQRDLWDKLVEQVREYGLVLGTQADLPPGRGNEVERQYETGERRSRRQGCGCGRSSRCSN